MKLTHFFFSIVALFIADFQIMRLPPISPLLQRTFGSREPEHKTLQTIIDFALHLTFMILTKHPTISPSKRSEYGFYTYLGSSVLTLAMI